MAMKILLLSAYHAQSHKQWCDGLIKHLPQHHWTLLSLPPRHFAWRVRGNSLSWAFSHRQQLLSGYDLLIATSLVDLAALRGFVPALAQLPTLVYFHENQFEYPRSEHQKIAVEPQIVNLYSALCADQVLFNSAWNRDSFLSGVSRLLEKLPDHVPDALPDRLRQRSSLLPVGLDPELFGQEHPASDPPILRWKHRWEYDIVGEKPKEDSLIITWSARWEYDKGPDRLLSIVKALAAMGVDFRLNIIGQSFRKTPEDIANIRNEFGHLLLQYGFVDSRSAYLGILAQSDVILSTAHHEFQGIAVAEAVASGCYPLVPNAVVYPEIFAPSFCYNSVEECVRKLSELAVCKRNRQRLHIPDVSRFSWAELGPKYAATFSSLVDDHSKQK